MSRIRFYRDSKRKWRCQIKAVNGRIIFASSQGYARKAGARANVVMVRNTLDAAICRAGWDEL